MNKIDIKIIIANTNKCLHHLTIFVLNYLGKVTQLFPAFKWLHTTLIFFDFKLLFFPLSSFSIVFKKQRNPSLFLSIDTFLIACSKQHNIYTNFQSSNNLLFYSSEIETKTSILLAQALSLAQKQWRFWATRPSSYLSLYLEKQTLFSHSCSFYSRYFAGVYIWREFNWANHCCSSHSATKTYPAHHFSCIWGSLFRCQNSSLFIWIQCFSLIILFTIIPNLLYILIQQTQMVKKEVEAPKQDATKQAKPKHRPSRKQRMEEKSKIRVDQLRNKKTDVEKKLLVAQHATASVGHFNKKVHKEQKQMKVKRRKQYKNFKNVGEEIERNKDVLSQVIQSGLKKLNHSI